MSGNIQKSTSVYLDLLRIIAALWVFLGHASTILMPSMPGVISAYSREAVSIFFVLSGFVIFYVAGEKERDWKNYAAARIFRIYPVVILSLLVTRVADAVGHHFNPEVYSSIHAYTGEYIRSFFRYITFTNKIWFAHIVYGTNEPFWSLGFEVWYYILFGVYNFANRKYMWLAFMAILIFVGPKIAMYLPLWIIGGMTYQATNKLYLNRFTSITGFIFSIAGFFFTVFYLRDLIGPKTMFYKYTIPEELHNVLYYYIIGILTAINIVCFNAMTLNKSFWPKNSEYWITWLAGATFTIYLVHMPLQILISALIPSVKTNSAEGVLAIVILLIALLFLAECAERRKRFIRRISTVYVVDWSKSLFVKSRPNVPDLK